jgi:hypothetical protein
VVLLATAFVLGIVATLVVPRLVGSVRLSARS